MNALQSRRRVERYDFFVLVVLLSSACLATGLLSVLALQALDEDDTPRITVWTAEPSLTPLPPPQLSSDILSLYLAGEPIVFEGQALAASTVQLMEQNRVLANTAANTYGNWQLDIAEGLPAGTYTLALVATDGTQQSERLLVRVEVQPRTVGGVPATGPTLAYGDAAVRVAPPQIQPLNSESFQSGGLLAVRGTASGARFVAVLDGERVLARAEVNILGQWQAEIQLEAERAYALMVQAVDGNGNRSRAVSVPIMAANRGTMSATLAP